MMKSQIIKTFFKKNAFKALKKFGANFNITDNAGLTPLHIACLWHNLKIIKTLFQVNHLNIMYKQANTGNTALHYYLTIINLLSL